MKLFNIKAILLVAMACLALPMIAQDEDEAPAGKPNVYIDYFSRPSDVPFKWAEDLRNKVIEGLQSTQRVEVIDVDSNSALAIEQSRREQDNVTAGDDMERLAVMTQEGANYLISGTVTAIKAVYNPPKDGSDAYYAATSHLTLKVIDPKTGKLVSTKTITLGDKIAHLNTGSSADEAVAKANNNVKGEIKRYVDEVFKVKGQILEVDEQKKGEAKYVFISVGSDQGIIKGVNFTAYIEREVAGRQSKKTIGELKVEDVQGGDLTRCEVKKGGKEIMEAINAGQTVKVEVKPKGPKIWEQI